MKEIFGNAEYLQKDFTYLCITTNGFVKNNGEAVMGRGIAHTITYVDETIPKRLGSLIKENGNVVQQITSKYLAFPVKHNWWEVADVELIKKSAYALMKYLNEDETALLPRPGCGNGKLDWLTQVKPAIEEILDDRVTIIDWSIDV